MLHKCWLQYLTSISDEMSPSKSSPSAGMDQSKYFLRCSKPTLTLFRLIRSLRWTAFQSFCDISWVSGRCGFKGCSLLGLSDELPGSVCLAQCHRLATLLTQKLGTGTSHHDFTSLFRRIWKWSSFTLFSLVVLWVIIEIHEVCCCDMASLVHPQEEADRWTQNTTWAQVFWKARHSLVGGEQRAGVQKREREKDWQGRHGGTICMSPHSQLIQPESVTRIQQQLKQAAMRERQFPAKLEDN